MITLEQFRASASSVPDVAAYDGSECNHPRSGRVYMDGRYSIEMALSADNVAEGWCLTIANMSYSDRSIEPLEAILYEWMLTECSDLMAWPFRLPKLQLNPSTDEASHWVRFLASLWPERLYPNEAAALSQNIADIRRCLTVALPKT